MVDLVLSGGTVVDGLRGIPYRADVCIRDGKIAAIERNYSGERGETVDVAGRIVSPGFIDIHTHSDVCPFAGFRPESKICQGVTFELAGNCGVSSIPLSQTFRQQQADYFIGTLEVGVGAEALRADTVQQYAEEVARVGYPSNLGMLVGHGTLRACVMGFADREPTGGELEEMKAILDRELAAGAFGLSLGLIYPPGSFSKTPELTALARVVKAHGKLVAVHMRDEGPEIFEAVDEMLGVAADSGVHLHISHLKLMGKPQWGRADQLLEKLQDARDKGCTITCDQYPYPATSTSLTALLPRWAFDGGVAKALERLAERSQKLLDHIGSELENRGGASTVMISSTRGHRPALEGRTIDRIAEEAGVSPADAVVDVLVACKGSVAAIYFTISEEDMRLIMKDMRIAVGSDGYAFTYDRSIQTSSPHPRSFGTFPRFLQTVRDFGLMPLQDAVYKLTGLPAGILGLQDRGVLEVGRMADITVFDYDRVADRCTFQDSLQKPAGILHTLVGGVFVLREGEPVNERPGVMLLRR